MTGFWGIETDVIKDIIKNIRYVRLIGLVIGNFNPK